MFKDQKGAIEGLRKQWEQTCNLQYQRRMGEYCNEENMTMRCQFAHAKNLKTSNLCIHYHHSNIDASINRIAEEKLTPVKNPHTHTHTHSLQIFASLHLDSHGNMTRFICRMTASERNGFTAAPSETATSLRHFLKIIFFLHNIIQAEYL